MDLLKTTASTFLPAGKNTLIYCKLSWQRLLFEQTRDTSLFWSGQCLKFLFQLMNRLVYNERTESIQLSKQATSWRSVLQPVAMANLLRSLCSPLYFHLKYKESLLLNQRPYFLQPQPL